MTLRTETKKQLDSMNDDLTRLRDEIRLYAHLASMDLRDEVATLEPQIEAFERRATTTTTEVGKEMNEAWLHLKKALERVRDELLASAP